MPLSSQDRLAVMERAARYCHAGDLGDGESWAANFTEDGVLEGPLEGMTTVGREQIARMRAAGGEPGAQGRHLTYNFIIDGDGDRATSNCYVTAITFTLGERAETIFVGRYQDQLRKVDGAWMLERRKIITDWVDESVAKRLDEARTATTGSVKFSGRVADLADEKRHAELPWISIPARDHQPRRMAVPSILCELSRCRRSPGPTRHHGVLRSDPALVHPVRLGIRSQAQASTGPAGRHMALGRGLRHHPGTAALSLACRRSRWRRHRHPRPVASRPPGCQTLYPQAVEGSGE